MKILFCTNTFENVRNGPAKFASYLLEMNRLFQNVEIRILTEDISDHSASQYRDRIYKLDLKLGRFTKPWGFAYRMFPYYKACLAVKSTFAYDIVVFNNAITGIWSSIFLVTPVIGMINDDNSLSIRWKNFSYTHKWFRHFIFKYLEKLACLTETGILVNSRFLLDQVSKNYKIRPEKLHILHKSVKTDIFPSNKSVDFQWPVKILFVKSDFIRGGLFDLISALGLLKNYDFELQIVGPEETHKQEILNSNKYSNLTITFIGPASPEIVKNRMLNNDLFIVPSRQEALGVANLEALAHGLTVISTNTGGIPEALNFGANGWMANPGKPNELAQLIQQVIENPQERLIKQKNGFDYVRKNFSTEGTE